MQVSVLCKGHARTQPHQKPSRANGNFAHRVDEVSILISDLWNQNNKSTQAPGISLGTWNPTKICSTLRRLLCCSFLCMPNMNFLEYQWTSGNLFNQPGKKLQGWCHLFHFVFFLEALNKKFSKLFLVVHRTQNLNIFKAETSVAVTKTSWLDTTLNDTGKATPYNICHKSGTVLARMCSVAVESIWRHSKMT